MNNPDPKESKPSEVETERAPEPVDLSDVEDRMADYLWNGTVDGEVFDGDPADLDWF